MSDRSLRDYRTTDLFALAIVCGIFGGLLEGVVHIALQRLHILDNSWYPIIWIAAVVNTLILVSLVTVSMVALAWLSPARRQQITLFLVLLAGITPWFVLALKEWIHMYALALLTLGVTSTIARGESRRPAAARRWWRLTPVAMTALVVAFVAIEGGAWWSERNGESKLPAADADAPNVLVVVIDALRADHVSAYGYGRPTTPAIDRLAADGVLFETALSTSSYTLPSHASMVRGQFVQEHHVEWDSSRAHFAGGARNLPEVLTTAGYRTGAFSGNTFYFSREHGFGRGFLHFEDYFHSAADMFWRTAYGGILTKLVRPRLGFEDLPGRKRASDTNEAVSSWVRRTPDRPFFVMVNYMDVHDPYLPAEPYATRFSNTPPAGRLNFKLHVPDQLTEAELEAEIAAYDGALAYADAQLESLVSSLREASTRELIVIITSDHGEEFGEHGGYLHGRHLYFEALHVPLIVWAPGRVPAGRRVATPVSNASIPATVMSLLGIADASFSQPSLAPLWSGAPPSEWPVALAELKKRTWAPKRDPVHEGSLQAGVFGEWHVIRRDGQHPQLFNLSRDRREAQDVAAIQPDAEALIRRVLALFR